MFVGTFVYCMAGALSIEAVEVQPDGARLTATVGLYLTLATFASLILLVQHISTMLQAPNIAAAAGAELVDVVKAAFADDTTSGDGGTTALQTRSDAQLAPATLVEAEGYAAMGRLVSTP
jgi:uncharacterized membrane protein